MKLNNEIESLRAQGSSPEAKARVIAKLQRRDKKQTMKMIGKLSIPAAAIVALAFATPFTMSRPALASTTSVARAIRDVKNYVINSFTIVDGKRTLVSKTTVLDGHSSRQFFDEKGNQLSEGKMTSLDGTLHELVTGQPLAGVLINKKLDAKGNEVKITSGMPIGEVQGKKVEVRATKDKTGKLVKHTFVDGKEVKDLPAEFKDRAGIKVSETEGHNSATIRIGNNAPKTAGGFMVVEGGENGNFSLFASGQTSVDSLLKLLDDNTRWWIERGVNWNGKKLDKFKLKGEFSPIELYVDPATSLPIVLRFVGIGENNVPQVEDEYVYGARPPLK